MFNIGYDYENYRPSNCIKIFYPFKDSTKRTITVYQPSLDNNYKVYVMGSPDSILNECVEYISKSG